MGKTSKTLDIGDKAPQVSGNTDTGEKFSLSELKGKSPVVLYFYPKDDTPGCTKQACSFRDESSKFKKLGAVVVGVSPDSLISHGKFRKKYELDFPLLPDEEHKICEKYGVWVKKSMYGRQYWGVQRATFLIDKGGKIAAVWPKVKVDGHSEEVLAAIKSLA